MIKAVIFDMDGVLIDSEHHWQRTERALFAEFGINLTDELLHQTRGLTTEEMMDHWGRRFDLDGANPKDLMTRYDSLMVTCIANDVQMMDGARDTLQFFKDKKLPIALASCSTLDHIHAAMESHGIGDYFKMLVSASENMPGKPHPEVYLKTAESLKIDPTSCLAIEDSFYGVIAAKSARMKVVAMPDPLEFHQPRYGAADMKISSLREINEDTFDHLQKL
ncbi:MAG: hexitol phosphatase HxpB [Bacteroidota bacterium]